MNILADQQTGSASLLRSVSALMRAVASAEVMPRWGNLSSGDSREKGPDDWVTVADLSAEVALRAGLAAIDPGIPTVGEEEVSVDHSILGRLSGPAAWILDPVDGTRAFREGLPGFGMIVALSVEGRVGAGWILDCVEDTLVCARSGMGAFLCGNDGSLSPLKRPTPNPERVGTASKGVFRPLPGARYSSRFASASCMDYLDLVHGRSAFNMARVSWPWDHAAGSLLVTELGGIALRLDGSPYRLPGSDGGILAAIDPSAGTEILRDCLL